MSHHGYRPNAPLELRGRTLSVPYHAHVFFRSRLALRDARRSKRVESRHTITIRCSGRLHRITKIANGPFIFHDHTREELKALRVLRALGDTACACLAFPEKVFAAPSWRGDFNEAAKAMKAVRESRANLPARLDKSPLSTRRPSKDELRYNIFADMKREFELLIRGSREYLGVHVELGFATKDRPPGFFNLTQMVAYHATTNEWTDTCHQIGLAVPLGYVRNVRNGSALVDGRFIALDFKRISKLTAEATLIVQREPGVPHHGFVAKRATLAITNERFDHMNRPFVEGKERWIVVATE